MNDMKRLLRYAGPYRRDMVLGAVLVLIETCFELFIPIMIADLIDVGVANLRLRGGALGSFFYFALERELTEYLNVTIIT